MDQWKSSTHTTFLRPRPFGFGCASMRAAYSGSDAHYSERSMTERGIALKNYLDVDEVFEEFCLSKKIGITFHGIGNLGLKVERPRNGR